MLNSYDEFEKNMIDIIKVRSKNYTNTNCNIRAIIEVVYNEIIEEVNIDWIFQEYTIKEDKKLIVLPENNGDPTQDPELVPTERYGEVYDIINYAGLDMSDLFQAVDEGVFQFLNESLHQQYIGETFIFVRPKRIDIQALSPKYLNALYRALVEGIMYHIEVSVPSQVDVTFSNYTYQRYYNARKELINKFPQIKYYEKYTNLNGRLYHEPDRIQP
jgi:hypothetical protein